MDQTSLARLRELGWDDHFAESLAGLGDASLEPGRVAADHGAACLVHSAQATAPASLAGPLVAAGRPAVGDWVALRRGSGLDEIAAVLERRTAIRRRGPDVENREQVLAANVDLVLITTSLDGDFNPRRVERLLVAVGQSGADPAVLLTKPDLGDPTAARAELFSLAPGLPVLVCSPLTGEGVEAVGWLLGRGRTGVLIGSSGVGKSTLINRLAGAALLRTAAIHRSGQGRHTTSHRELLLLPGGGLLIDTPGLREVQLWAGEEALDQVFADIEELAATCRFSDCRHQTEPGCAVRAALDRGELEPARWASYRKLQRELRSIEVRSNARLRREESRRWRSLHRQARENVAARRGSG